MHKDPPHLLVIVLLLALLALYWPFLVSMAQAWDTNEDYSHGYFIPAVAAFMVYSLRAKLAVAEIRPLNSGFLLIVAGLALLVVAKIAAELFSQRFSLIVVLLGLIAFFYGRQYLRLLAVPVVYLIFMIPLPAIVWNEIAFPLQLFSSMLTEKVIYAAGIPVFREGNVLHLAETTLEVVAACSGLRSLVTMFALAGALAFLADLPLSRKWLFFLAAAPVAILANIIRLTFTAFLASRYGAKVADGFLHDFSGLLVFALGLTMLLVIHSLLARKTSR